MLKPTNNSSWFCILFKMKQLKRERQKKNHLKKVSSIKDKGFFSERLKIPVQITVGEWKYLGVVDEYLVQTLKEKVCNTLPPSPHFQIWPRLFPEENSQ